MDSLNRVLRKLRHAPVFIVIVLVTLALGIGSNTALFSVVNAVLIKPLPYPQSERLVGVWHTAPSVVGIRGDINCSPTMYFTYRETSHTFQDFGLWSNGRVSVTGVAEPEQVAAVFVTYGILQALGVQPAAGRWFSQADDTPATPETVILSYGYWQRRFGGNPSLIGRTLTVDSQQRIVVGVMPRNFRFLSASVDLILPMRFDRNKLFLGNFSYPGHSAAQAWRYGAAGQRRRGTDAPDLAASVAATARV